MINIDELFDNRQTIKRKSQPRTYDVRITLNKAGDNRSAIRFGFLNDAVSAFGSKSYIQVSKVESLPTRIYFRLFDNKANLDAHKLCTNSKAKATNLYATITPSVNAEKIYRMKWINKTFKIKYDTTHDLYYVELSEEEETA